MMARFSRMTRSTVVIGLKLLLQFLSLWILGSSAQESCISSPCLHGSLCFNEIGGYKCNCDPGYTGFYCETAEQKKCSQISTRPYPILIQQHIGGSSFFNKNWTQMMEEQGSTTEDYWLGLRELSQILQEGQGRFRLKVNLWSKTTGYLSSVQYETFMIGKESDNFTLTVGGWSGNAQDALQHHNGMQFSTYDRDNDKSSNTNVAADVRGAWWYPSYVCYACVNAYYNDFIWNSGVTLYLQKTSLYLECKYE